MSSRRTSHLIVYDCSRPVMPGSGSVKFVVVVAYGIGDAREILSSVPGVGRLDHWNMKWTGAAPPSFRRGVYLSRREGEK